MSVDKHNIDPIITTENYEEYFLMYVDGELTPREQGLVEAFLQFHPGLKAELDGLMGTKLEPEAFYFDGKESLLAHNMEQAAIDEALLLHLDGELPRHEAEKVEQRLEKEPAYAAQYQLLLRTKPNPAEVVPCPNKEALYRRTVRRIGLAPLLRIAAAVLLLASLGVLWHTAQQPEESGGVAATQISTPKSAPHNMVPAAPTETAAVKKEQSAVPPVVIAVPGQKKAEQKVAKTTREPVNNAVLAQAVQKKAPAPLPDEAPVVEASMPRPSVEGPLAKAGLPDAVKNADHPVTSPATHPYNAIENPVEPQFASQSGPSGKTNLKSLLRRATRLVERRANIDATNDDDELIIGAVAIKLK